MIEDSISEETRVNLSGCHKKEIVTRSGNGLNEKMRQGMKTGPPYTPCMRTGPPYTPHMRTGPPYTLT